MSQPRIFVSYSRKDRDITQRLVSDLHRAGAEVWVDVEGITSGNFMQAIDKALAQCDWMVLVLSPSAIASEYVPEETYTALHRVKQGYMKGVIPVLVAPCTPGSIPPQWDVLQRYDATRDYAGALAGVVRAIGLSSFTSSPVIPADGFPKRLAELGFTAHSDKGIEYILPPLCLVPAGPFLMGSDPKRDPVAAKDSRATDEQPQHTVTLPAYDIARFPVTVAEYACFVRTGQREPSNWQTQLSKLDHPVVDVSWHDAVAYTTWLSERKGEQWRLPTEAEWEKSARGTEGQIYPWGDAFDTARCNTSESGIRATRPIGSYPSGASPYGSQDMAGNVWEWTSSRYLPYPYTSSAEREDSKSTDERVLRGGAWNRVAGDARAAFRLHGPLGYFSGTDSFRIVRAAPSS